MHKIAKPRDEFFALWRDCTGQIHPDQTTDDLRSTGLIHFHNGGWLLTTQRFGDFSAHDRLLLDLLYVLKIMPCNSNMANIQTRFVQYVLTHYSLDGALEIAGRQRASELNPNYSIEHAENIIRVGFDCQWVLKRQGGLRYVDPPQPLARRVLDDVSLRAGAFARIARAIIG